jgi:Fe-S-cluster containining protein
MLSLHVVKVDCRTCHACCEAGTYAALLPVDDAAAYQTEVVNGQLRLARKPDDDCIYLDRDRHVCTIYDRRPTVCRQFSCIESVRHGHVISDSVFAAGIKRLPKAGAA